MQRLEALTLSTCDMALGPILLLSHLEKACLSGSSPASTQRCRAAEKCPQATAISEKQTEHETYSNIRDRTN